MKGFFVILPSMISNYNIDNLIITQSYSDEKRIIKLNNASKETKDIQLIFYIGTIKIPVFMFTTSLSPVTIG